MKYTDIRGIIVPILTPMDENEQINLPVLREQIERMIVGGVNGIFPLGTNGEAYILSEKEKLEVLNRLWMTTIPVWKPPSIKWLGAFRSTPVQAASPRPRPSA